MMGNEMREWRVKRDSEDQCCPEIEDKPGFTGEPVRWDNVSRTFVPTEPAIPESFCFDRAVGLLRAGKVVRRHGWMGMFLYMLPAQNVTIADRMLAHPPRLFVAHFPTLERERAALTDEDVVADDWEMYG